MGPTKSSNNSNAILYPPALNTGFINSNYLNPKDPFVCPKKGMGRLYSYSKDGIGTINPLLGRDLDP